MEKPLLEIYQTLQKLMGLHRQLLETVRQERDALAQADLKAIQDAACAKQAIIEAVRVAESERIKHTAVLSVIWKTPLRDLTLPNIIIAIQGDDAKAAEQLRSAYNALTLLIKRVSEQNQENKAFLEKSLEHIQKMKMNVLGEAVPNTNTYSQQGQKVGGPGGARFISKEA